MADNETNPQAPPPDARLYAHAPEGWEAHIKQGWDKDYCFAKAPGEDWFHLLMSGEIYLQHGTEKYCLNCALRRGILTTDRLYWQHQSQTSRERIL